MPVLRLPYVYEVGYLPERARAPRLAFVREYADFSVPEADDETAPVYMEWTPQEGAPRVERRRTFEGRSYRPLGTAGPVSAEDLVEATSARDADSAAWKGTLRWEDLPRPPATRDRVGSHGAPVRFEDPATLVGRRGRVVSGDPDRGLAEGAATWREGLLVVGGEAWVAAPEPTYVVVLMDDRVVLSSTARSGRTDVDEARFRADDRASAEGLAAEFARRRGVEILDVTEDRPIVVRTPGAPLSDPATLLAEDALLRRMVRYPAWTKGMTKASGVLERCAATAAGERDANWARTALAAMSAFSEGARVAGAGTRSGNDVAVRQAGDFAMHVVAWDRFVAPAIEAAEAAEAADMESVGMSF